jgi:hypothetical protein
MAAGQRHRFLAVGAGLALVVMAAGSTVAGGHGELVPRQILMAPKGAVHAARPVRGGSKNLSYHGGVGGVGVETGAD